MNKKLIALLLAVLMLMSAAMAETLTNALPKIDHTVFEKYASYTFDESTGEWSVHSNEADAALTMLDEGGNSNIILFYLELTGNARTGVVVPVLTAIYAGNPPKATAASFRVDDVRYDYTVAAEAGTKGDSRCETERIYMDAQGLKMLRDIESADLVSVRLHGNLMRNMEIERKEKYSSSGERLRASSLLSSKAILDELDAMGFDSYALWDVSDTVWEKRFKTEPMSAVTKMVGESEDPDSKDDIELKEDFEMLSKGDSDTPVANLQKLLMNKGFLMGSVNSSYDASTVTAVSRAQQFYGLPVTGSADRALVDLLKGDAEAAAEDEEQADAMQYAGSVVALRLDRCWMADAVLTSDGSAEHAGANSDNTLLIVEGVIQNMSMENLDLYWQIEGELLYDGQYSYPLTFQCERDGGKQFDTTMIPLAESRLVASAEIPAKVAMGDGSCVLRLTIGEDIVEYTVQ